MTHTEPVAAPFPAVRREHRAGAVALTINGERHLPLIFAFARTHYIARTLDGEQGFSFLNPPADGTTSSGARRGYDYAGDVVYEQLGRVYAAGIRIFHPCMPDIGWGPDGEFNYRNFDTVMRRLVEVLPEAYFILRVIIPPPPLPKDEQILVSRRPGDTSDAEACQVFDQISLFSETYRAYAPGAMTKIMQHLAALPQAGRIIGTVICGAGFEWNWGNPGGNWGLMMDICPAVTREFGRFLERKYGTVDALRAAWGDPAADFANPPLPGIEERTLSDVGGFRDPSQPRSRWIQDFLDCYNDHPTRVLTTIFDRLTPDATSFVDATPSSRAGAKESGDGAASTALFHGVFGMAVMNTAYSGVQTMPGEFRPVLEHPALGFITCCLTYCDRKAGGVSVYMNAGYHSHTLHGKLAIGEADIRPGTANDPWNEASIEDGVASMRREFAAMLLCQRQGIWYFDMPGGWFDRPELLAELGRQQEVGQALLDLPHTNVAETLVVFENRSWKYFGLADHKLALKTVWSGGNQQLLSDMTQDNIERLQRLGAPNDAIVAEDFGHPDLGAYKLMIFPFSFLCDPATRAEIHRRVEAGATALFLYAAGIVDGETASVENMERLLGMKMRVDGPSVLAAVLDSGVFPLPAEGEGQGEGVSAHLGNLNTHHFRYVIDDPRATPLAHYDDGEVAAAMVPRGKGRIILSAVPAASPALYKLAARIAGVHLYSDTDDALYASGEFLVIHTREAGMKRLRFPHLVTQVKEVFTGEVIARNVTEVTVNLPAKTTAVYRLGGDLS
jgi:hypothetical protein